MKKNHILNQNMQSIILLLSHSTVFLEQINGDIFVLGMVTRDPNHKIHYIANISLHDHVIY